MMNVLCISFYFKGEEFLKSCKRAGNTVYLLTHRKLDNKPWPRDAVDEFFYMDNDANSPENIDNIIKGFAWLIREKRIDTIIALDDFDVEKATAIREEFRIPGMGQTTGRYYRDKLAMRMRAQNEGISVPPFTAIFNNEDVHDFTQLVPSPWVLKPRSEASAAGIKKIHNEEDLWHHINGLGDQRHRFLLEQFMPGDVYHADALSFDGDLVFCWASRYLTTPFEVAHGAGIFRSITLDPKGMDFVQLRNLTSDVMQAFGMRYSASHTEFIKSSDNGRFYFLETSCRVGGAHLATMIEAASGVNLWWEWARIETASAMEEGYTVPESRNDFAGILISLARQEHPDLKTFDAPEITWKLKEPHHVGFVLRSDSAERVQELLDEYAEIVRTDYHASMPMGDKPTN
jgi:biotin carboxylase